METAPMASAVDARNTRLVSRDGSLDMASPPQQSRIASRKCIRYFANDHGGFSVGIPPVHFGDTWAKCGAHGVLADARSVSARTPGMNRAWLVARRLHAVVGRGLTH